MHCAGVWHVPADRGAADVHTRPQPPNIRLDPTGEIRKIVIMTDARASGRAFCFRAREHVWTGRQKQTETSERILRLNFIETCFRYQPARGPQSRAPAPSAGRRPEAPRRCAGERRAEARPAVPVW